MFVDYSQLVTNDTFTSIQATVLEGVPIHTKVTQVDSDGTALISSKVNYTIVSEDVDDDDVPFTIDGETGEIFTNKVLDREEKQVYTFLVKIEDASSPSVLPNDTTNEPNYVIKNIQIIIGDKNDNPPNFEQALYNAEVSEDADINYTVITVTAKDKDEYSKIRYEITRGNVGGAFAVKNETGAIYVAGPLDHETRKEYKLRLVASDSLNENYTTVVINLKDVNDNAPKFFGNSRPTVLEVIEPPIKVTEIMATDDDDRSKGNGPPFTFRLSEDAPEYIKEFFDVQTDVKGANGDGIGIVTSKKEFDRETQNEYYVPIVIGDAGNPALSSTSTLTVIIGDINDNHMYPGNKNILMYNFQGQSPPTPIGRVHVEDLDDCDLPDKFFIWVGRAHTLFDINKHDGMITMKNVTDGEYFLNFKVYDRRYTERVLANVTVTVQKLPEEAVYNSGSIRVSGITAEDFIRVWFPRKTKQPEKSKYDKLKDVLSRLLEVDRDQVDVFSIITRSEQPPVIDIRFAVHGSSYLKAYFLNGVVTLNRKVIEHEVGINITMVGIDECLVENLNCNSSSCSNTLKIDPQPIVVNANRTSFVGVNVHVMPTCACDRHDFEKSETCQKMPQQCLSSGSCTDSFVGSVGSESYTGSSCKIASRTFHGDGWAWYAPLQACDDSHLSIEFKTRTPGGLLFYNGPIGEPIEGEYSVKDFVLLELQGGNPRLLIDFGSGTTELTVHPIGKLHNGEWHRIDLFWTKETARIVLDNCVGVPINDDDPSRVDRSRCENITQLMGLNELLNVNNPLQLGGIYQKQALTIANSSIFANANYYHLPTKQGFNGCIRNVVHNNLMYDLGTPGWYANSVAGCWVPEELCQANSTFNL